MGTSLGLFSDRCKQLRNEGEQHWRYVCFPPEMLLDDRTGWKWVHPSSLLSGEQAQTYCPKHFVLPSFVALFEIAVCVISIFFKLLCFSVD